MGMEMEMGMGMGRCEMGANSNRFTNHDSRVSAIANQQSPKSLSLSWNSGFPAITDHSVISGHWTVIGTIPQRASPHLVICQSAVSPS